MTIVIPSYNQQEFLPDAIDSALKQGSDIIIVDDGSTDNSLQIALNYQMSFSRIKVISQVNKGLASARNTGIMNATSDYILFLDADDILLDNAVKRITETIKETDADIVSPSFKCFGTSEQEVILGQPTLEDFKTANRIGYCSAVKRSMLLAVGGYSPKMVEGYEDYHIWFDLLKRGCKLVTIPEVLWLYRTKKESMYTKITPEIHEKLMSQIRKDFLW